MNSDVFQIGNCACKGIRHCLLCEHDNSLHTEEKQEHVPYVYCNDCQLAWVSENLQNHPFHSGMKMIFPGVHIIENFISENEELNLINSINSSKWIDSQSGRRKQDFGPKVNFKKRKIKISAFSGLPAYSEMMYHRMKTLEVLKNFLPVEMCNLEYDPVRGSAIDPHFDDFWLWGERLVTINMLSDTVMSMNNEKNPFVEVNIPLPRLSLVILYGEARYDWKHSIKRENILSKRIAITFRELTSEFLLGGDRECDGNELLNIALTFNGTPVVT